MKVCVFQPPYSMNISDSDELFRYKLDLLRQCDDTMDIIVLPEYSEVPVRVATREDTIAIHNKNVDTLLKTCGETAIRCNALVFVNALSKTEAGYRNTTYAFDRNGNIIGKYFKRHLPPLELEVKKLDHSYADEFTEPYILEAEGLKFAFFTCYDFYFYEAFSNIARKNVDIIIGCSLQRSDTHSALETLTRFCAYNCNAYLLRSSVSLGESSEVGGSSMIVAPDGEILADMKNNVGFVTAEINPEKKYLKPAGFGNSDAPHWQYIENGRRPWQYRPCGSAICLPDSEMPYPRVCAHRGFNTIAPENSMPAFGAAVALGAEEIEFDLWYTKDREIVSIHDSSLERVSDGIGQVYEHTYEELLKYDFGFKHGEKYKGLKILKFEDILKKFACHVIMNIHIKTMDNECEYDRDLLEKIVALIDKYDCRKYVYFMCGNDNFHKLAKELAPDICRCTGAGSKAWEIVDRAIEYDCQKVQLFKPHFNQEMIDKAHAHGIICNVFYADTPEEAIKYREMGIDTILTNDYSLVSQAIKRK